jgi:hypothetical protein
VINGKGGERIKPKAKGPHHHILKIFIWYLFQKGNHLKKHILKAKGRISSGGAFINQRKSI